MKISTRGRYALRLMLDLAICGRERYVPLREVAGRQGISDKYMEQIITRLSRAGFVESVRGAQGGYRLTRDPGEYTVGMILRLTEGSLAPVECLSSEKNECPRAGFCPTLGVWQRVMAAVEGVVDSVTLADLVADSAEKCRIPIEIF